MALSLGWMWAFSKKWCSCLGFLVLFTQAERGGDYGARLEDGSRFLETCERHDLLICSCAIGSRGRTRMLGWNGSGVPILEKGGDGYALRQYLSTSVLLVGRETIGGVNVDDIRDSIQNGIGFLHVHIRRTFRLNLFFQAHSIKNLLFFPLRMYVHSLISCFATIVLCDCHFWLMLRDKAVKPVESQASSLTGLRSCCDSNRHDARKATKR
jgi:hypothetical protein